MDEPESPTVIKDIANQMLQELYHKGYQNKLTNPNSLISKLKMKNIAEKPPSPTFRAPDWKLDRKKKINDDFSDFGWTIGKDSFNKATHFNKTKREINE